MSTVPFAAEQRRFFHARCEAVNQCCALFGLRPLVIMGHREVFDFFCAGDRSGALQPRAVNDNGLPSTYPP